MEKERITGSSETEAEGGHVDSRMHLRVGPDVPGSTESANRNASDDSSLTDDARNRAAEFAADTRDRLIEGVSKVGADFEERTGIIRAAREHPIATLAIAFSAGFLVAAATGGSDRNWIIERSRRQLRTAIIGGVTAALAHELRSLIGAEEGFGDLVQSFLQGDDEEDFEI